MTQRTVMLAAALVAMHGVFAGVVKYDSASGVTDLSQAAAWVGGACPTENDVALLTQMGGDYSLGAATSWRGIVYSNLTAKVTLSGATLTLGESGISTGGPVRPGAALVLEAPVVLSCDQEWYSFAAWESPITVRGGVSGPGKLITRNYPNYAKSCYGICSLIDTDWDAHGFMQRIEGGATYEAAIGGTVNLGWGHAVHLVTPIENEMAFTNIFRKGYIENDGNVLFGQYSEPTRTVNLRFEEGNRIVGKETLTAASAASINGRVTHQLGRFRMTGGEIVNNSFLLGGGDYEQTGGSVWLRYELGGLPGNIGTGQRFLVNGEDAAIDANAVVLGDNNTERMPNWMIVSNGTVSARSGVNMAKATEAAGANTRLEVSGGKLTAGALSFGASGAANKNGFAEVVVNGGELAVGAGGVAFDETSWYAGEDPEGPDGSWCRFTLAGGLYRACRNQENNVAMTLAGGKIVVDEGVVMEQRGRLSGTTLLKEGKGVLSLPNVCAWTGDTVVAEGTLFSRGGVSPRVPFLAYTADSLALADGATVYDWVAVSSDGRRTNSFANAVTAAVGIPARPTFRKNAVNGHAAVSFNGTNQGLAMTAGTPDTGNHGPLCQATNFTVAVVFRPTSGVGNSGAGSSAMSASGVLGMYYNNANSRWGMSLAADGVLAGGTANSTGGCSVWSQAPSLIDGKTHVAFCNWTAKGKLRVNVDGLWTEAVDAVGFDAVSNNRMLLGASENTGGYAFTYFGGDIAEVRIYRNDLLSDADIDAIGLDLTLTYGAVYRQQFGAFAGDAATGSDVAVPAATGVWCADDLAQSAGDTVSVWKDPVNEGEFNTTVGKAIKNDTDAPVVSSRTINGHKALYFDGTKKMLGMTGGKGSTYIGSVGKEFTVAIVLRPEGSVGPGRANSFGAMGIIGQAYTGEVTQNKWAVGISGAVATGSEQFGMGVKDGVKSPVDVYGKPRYLVGDQAHVVICSYGENLTINVDGVRTTRKQATTLARTAGRTTLGYVEPTAKASDNNDKYSSTYFKGEIAEIRFFADKRLTVAEQNALGRALAEKYGVDAGGYHEEDESVCLTKRITVAAGAQVMGGGAGFRVADGATLVGPGSVAGRFVFGKDGVLDAAGDAPAFADGAVAAFEGGACVKMKVDAETGKVVPLALKGVVWPSDGGLTVDVLGAETLRNGVVFTWEEGEAPDTSAWKLVGGDEGARFVADPIRRCVKVKTTIGLMLFMK